MSYETYENSRDLGQPVELFEFAVADSGFDPLRYTSADEDVTIGAATYKAVTATRDAIRVKGQPDGQEVTVELPLNTEIADVFRVYPPSRVVTVKISQAHIANAEDAPGETSPALLWVGRVLETRRDKNRVVLTCDNSAAGMQRVGLRRHYQITCPHVLFGSRCLADKQNARQDVVVQQIDRNKLTFPVGWLGGRSREAYVGGTVEWSGPAGLEVRTILRVETDSEVTLSALPAGLSTGDTVEAYLGCGRTRQSCADLHNNIVNFGGFPFIPTHNPSGKNNHT